MSNENDSWFKSAFGIDLGKAVDKIKDDVSAAASSVAQVVGKAAGTANVPSVAAGSGSFPLGGSVGLKGKNAASDVRAVQAALGIPADGDCGPKTVAAIKAFQKQMGQAKPDGRVDAGGATERALARATTPEVTPGAADSPPPARYHLENAWPAKSQFSGDPVKRTATEGDLGAALREQRAALEQSLKNAGSDAEREQIEQELEGVDAEIASERGAPATKGGVSGLIDGVRDMLSESDVGRRLKEVYDAGVKAAGVTVKAPQPGSGWGDVGDDSWIKFSPRVVLRVAGEVRADEAFAKSTAVEIGAGETGQLTIDMVISGETDNFTPGTDESFTHKFSVSWDIAADESGTLTFETPQEDWGEPTPGTYYRVDSLNPDHGKTFVQVSPVVAGGADQGSLPIVGGIAREAPPPKIKQTFRVDVRVKLAEKPKPRVKVEIEQLDVPLNIEHTIGPFKVGSADELVSGTVEEEVYKLLFKKLPPEVSDDLIQGKLLGDGSKIEVHGYASNTDKQGANDKLSKRRAKAVVDVLIGRGVSDKVLTSPIPHGEWEVADPSGMAPTDDKSKERESGEWRKVVLKIKAKFKLPIPKVVPDP